MQLNLLVLAPPGITWSHGPNPTPIKKHKKAENLEDLVANPNLPSADSLEDKNALATTIAFLAALLPAEHPAT